MERQTTGPGPQSAKPRTYTDECRRQVVDMVTSTGRPATSVAAEVGMRDRLRAELATAALMMATQGQRPQPGLIQHSDRGVQHACTDYQEALAAAGIRPSMSRRGNALDNAPMESFSHTRTPA